MHLFVSSTRRINGCSRLNVSISASASLYIYSFTYIIYMCFTNSKHLEVFRCIRTVVQIIYVALKFCNATKTRYTLNSKAIGHFYHTVLGASIYSGSYYLIIFRTQSTQRLVKLVASAIMLQANYPSPFVELLGNLFCQVSSGKWVLVGHELSFHLELLYAPFHSWCSDFKYDLS